MIARPEALAVASPGQAQLQIIDLALIPIVGIRPRIDHIKLHKHTQRLLLSPSVRVARSKLFLFISLIFSVLQTHATIVYLYTADPSYPTDLEHKPTRTQLGTSQTKSYTPTWSQTFLAS
jgi:hypothetical protein